MTSRTDAKGQVTGYSYDAYGCLTAVAHYPTGVANGADPAQQVNYYYDTNPYNDTIATNTWGRLAAVAFGNACQGLFSATASYIYMYGYNAAGRVTGQKMRVSVNQSSQQNQSGCAPYTAPDQTASYGWDTEGRMTSLTYPGSTDALAYTYNAMGQVAGMADSVTGKTATATYGTAGEMDSLSYPGASQSFTYNSLWQLTGDGTTQYVYPAGQNNGRISQSISGGQTVNYSYDSLNRLATAQATDGSWGNAYSYDGFGNLTAKTVTAGSAPTFTGSYNAGNQPYRGVNPNADANGNAIYGAIDPSTGSAMTYTYDVENRIMSAGSNGGSPTAYGYDPQGKRVMRQTLLAGGPNPPFTGVYNSEFTFYGVTGQRLSTFTVTSANYNNSGYCNGYNYCTGGPNTGFLYFGGRLLGLTDRLGSQRYGMSYYPWGEEKTSPPTPDGQVKFATYFRDMPGQDYADQRYYTANAGRFYTPDPSGMANVDMADPTSWNMYAYSSDDPINFNDPTGLDCASTPYYGNGRYQGTIGDIIASQSDVSILAGAMYTESGHGSGVDVYDEEWAIGAVIMNRWQFVNQNWYLSSSASGPSLNVSGWGTPGDSIKSIVENPSQFAIYTNTPTGVTLSASAQNNLNSALKSSPTSSLCGDLVEAITWANGMWSARNDHDLLLYNDLVLTGFNSFDPAHPSVPYEQKSGSFGDANTFYGVPVTYVSTTPIKPVRRPPVRPRPPRRPVVPGQ